MLKIALASMLLLATQVQAQMTLKHGFYLSESLGDIKADISGKHVDYTNFPTTGQAQNTNVTAYDGKISGARSFGYNARYVPKVGFGYELGFYFTKLKMPNQEISLVNDSGSVIKIPNASSSLVDANIEQPSSYMTTTDLYLGGLYNFATINEMTPYVGLGYAKVKGNWHKSYFSGVPGDPAYGTKGKTKVDGHYISAKVGVNFNKNYNLELEHAKHDIHADAFRSLNINGSDAEFDRTSVNLIYNF